MKINGFWGLVCAAEEQAASPACRQLGFSGLGAEVRAVSESGPLRMGLPPLVEFVRCPEEELASLEDCGLENWRGPGPPSPTASCGGTVLGVKCQPMPAQP